DVVHAQITGDARDLHHALNASNLGVSCRRLDADIRANVLNVDVARRLVYDDLLVEGAYLDVSSGLPNSQAKPSWHLHAGVTDDVQPERVPVAFDRDALGIVDVRDQAQAILVPAVGRDVALDGDVDQLNVSDVNVSFNH